MREILLEKLTVLQNRQCVQYTKILEITMSNVEISSTLKENEYSLINTITNKTISMLYPVDVNLLVVFEFSSKSRAKLFRLSKANSS